MNKISTLKNGALSFFTPSVSKLQILTFLVLTSFSTLLLAEDHVIDLGYGYYPAPPGTTGCSFSAPVIAATDASVSSGSSTTITTTSSQLNVFYTLRDASDNSLVEGAIRGTGSGLTFNTGNLSATTDFYVEAAQFDILDSTFGNALSFNDNADYVNTGTYSQTGNSITVEFWLKPDGNLGNGQWDRLVDNRWQLGSWLICGMGGNTNALNVAWNGTGNFLNTPANTVIPN